MENKDKVKVKWMVSFAGVSRYGFYEFDREDWKNMTPEDREKMLRETANAYIESRYEVME